MLNLFQIHFCFDLIFVDVEVKVTLRQIFWIEVLWHLTLTAEIEIVIILSL